MRICPAHESGGVGFGFGDGAGVVEGVADLDGVATGLGRTAGETVNTTGICVGASVFVGSVKLIVPTYVPAGRFVILINQDPDEFRVIFW